jgi:hypothetical protein
MILYHRTSAANAAQILRNGFRDGVGHYLTDQEWVGAWVSNVSPEVNEGAEGDTLLQVELSEQAVADYEWIEEDEPYREWLVLADLIDGQASVHVVDEGKV